MEWSASYRSVEKPSTEGEVEVDTFEKVVKCIVGDLRLRFPEGQPPEEYVLAAVRRKFPDGMNDGSKDALKAVWRGLKQKQ